MEGGEIMEKTLSNGPLRWYVLTTLSPQQTEIRLQAENAARSASGDSRGTLQYFIPYQFLKRRKGKGEPFGMASGEVPSIPRSPEQVKANNETRAALRRFIFLRAHEEELNAILNSDWNRWSDNRMQCYYDRERRKVTVPERMMEKFIDACCDLQIQFELVPSLDGLSADEEVLLNATPFRGERAKVLSVINTPQGPRLTLGLKIFSGAMVLRLNDIGENDIIRHPDEVVLTDDSHLIDNIQRRLLAILDRRVNGQLSDEERARDRETLNSLFNYRYHHFENPSARRHLLALMLLCAHLRKDKPSVSELTAAAHAELESINSRRSDKAATDVRAYLHCALYLATGNAAYREESKAYIRDHEPKSLALRRLVKLIRKKRV